ncbi:MAG: glycosyltransferase family 2 protein [Bacteroidales bacterium]|jgi:glycosyltransferase involved in cell wall biosynthesis|nr:glycosyltransferase family 2 protein [Bacteroidales bacterium]
MKLIIQIPCYNEEEMLERTIGDLPRRIEGVDIIEYLIVNDGSADKTVEVAERAGVHHIVNFNRNKGLARGFAAGIDACLRLGADVIINTDADNQYRGEDIERLARPILEGKADIVIGERPIGQTAHFSPLKKKLQRFGSWVVRVASKTSVPDAPSGFRAYSREAALRLNVINEYTYTLETIIQAGRNKMAIMSVPIRTNPQMRESRLFKSMWAYTRRSASVIVRSFLMYRPLAFFCILSLFFFVPGFIYITRFLWFYFTGQGGGHIQSLVIATMLILLSVVSLIAGLQADLMAANRRILEDIQYRMRKSESGGRGYEGYKK